MPAPFIDAGHLNLRLELNGKVMQDGSTDDLLFDIAALISGASQTMPLLPGDILLTGSPAGNGQHWKRFLQDGDVMTGSIAGLGTQVVRCVAEVRPMTAPSENPADLDRTDPEGEIGARAEAFRNWGRWGAVDVLGTLNFIDEQKRVDAAALVREGRVVSLSQSFDTNGPQKGWRRRTNPVHTMTDTGVDAERGNQGFPHGIGGADDVIAMPLQCSTQWDGLGHIFDHGMAWNGRRAGDVVTSEGDLVTGIEHAASVIVSRGVLLDVGRHLQPETGELADGYAITVADLEATRRRAGRDGRPRRHRARAHRPARPRAPRRLGRLRRRPRARTVAHHRRLAAPHRDRGDRDRHVGVRGAAERVRRARVPAAAPGRDPEPRAHDRRDVGPRVPRRESAPSTGRYDFLLSAPPLPITGAVGSPINPVAIL